MDKVFKVEFPIEFGLDNLSIKNFDIPVIKIFTSETLFINETKIEWYPIEIKFNDLPSNAEEKLSEIFTNETEFTLLLDRFTGEASTQWKLIDTKIIKQGNESITVMPRRLVVFQ